MSAVTIAAQKKRDAMNKKRREREKRKRDEKNESEMRKKLLRRHLKGKTRQSLLVLYTTRTTTAMILLATMEPRGRNKRLLNKRLQSTFTYNPLHPPFVRHPPRDLKGRSIQLLLQSEDLASSNLTNLTMSSMVLSQRNFHASYGSFPLLT